MSVFVIVDHPTDHHFSGLSVNNQDWMSSIDIDYVFGGFDDYNANIIYSTDFIDYLPNNDIKLVLKIAFLPMVFNLNLDKKIIDKINNKKNTYLWIFCPHEYITDISIVVKELKSKGIDLNKVIFSSNNADKDGYDRNGILWAGIDDWHEARYRYNVRAYHNIGHINPKTKFDALATAQKKYICLLRNSKEHRYSLFYYLNKTGIFNQGHVSFHCNKQDLAGRGGGDYIEKLKTAMHLGLLDRNDLTPALKSKFMSSVINLDELDHIKDNNRKTIEPFYLDSLISIVSESNVVGNFNTEKVFKAVTHCHPFVVQCDFIQLENLKSKGYKLYEEVFDGYNYIREPKETQEYLQSIKRLSFEELRKRVVNNWNTVEYNYKHFFSRKILLKKHFDNIIKKVK